MQINFTRKFVKQRDKADRKIQKALRERLKLFKEDSFHPLLNNHALAGKFVGCRSINVTGDWRAIYREEKDRIIFLVLGTHNQLYR